MRRGKLFWPIFLGIAALLTGVGEFVLDDPADPGAASAVSRADARTQPRPAEAAAAPRAERAPLEVARAEVARAEVARAEAPGLDFPLSRRGPAPGELFVGKSFAVPPPPPPPPAPPPPPPPPRAPSLPFTYVGKLLEGERLTAYLTQGQRLITVTEGQVIDELYRVEQIGPRQMTFIYLPLNQSQTLAAGAPL